MNLQPLTLLAVKYAALLTIEAKGTTTTLDVKNVLRSLNYSANQDQVSELMMQASEELPLDYNANGIHRVYTLPDPSAVAGDGLMGVNNQSGSIDPQNTNDGVSLQWIIEDQLSKVGSIYQYYKRDGSIVRNCPESSAVEGSWVVQSGHNDREALYFNSQYSRDEVRQVFSKVFNVPFHDTRASVVRNGVV